MNIPSSIVFNQIDWSKIEIETVAGKSGSATIQKVKFGDIQMRKVEYSPDYEADHICCKGHIIHCLAGEMKLELETNTTIISEGQSVIIGDDVCNHRLLSKNGVTLFIVD